jgi:hypothetical protein
MLSFTRKILYDLFTQQQQKPDNNTDKQDIFVYLSTYLKTTTCDGSHFAEERQLTTHFEIVTILK